MPEERQIPSAVELIHLHYIRRRRLRQALQGTLTVWWSGDEEDALQCDDDGDGCDGEE